MIIGTIVPSNFFAPWEFVSCLTKATAYYPFIWVQSHSVPDNRNRVWDKVKELNDDLLFIDADMVFGLEDVERIKEHLEKYDVITGVYKLMDEKYALFERNKEDTDYEFIEPQSGIHKVDAAGAGFLGISKRVYDKLPSNPFSNVWEGNIIHGEDISFFHQLRKAGIQAFCDSSITLGHIRTKIIK